MQHAIFDLLRAALVPELGADISAGAPCNIHLVLVGVAAVGTYPNQLVIPLLYANLPVIAAFLTEKSGFYFCCHLF